MIFLSPEPTVAKEEATRRQNRSSTTKKKITLPPGWLCGLTHQLDQRGREAGRRFETAPRQSFIGLHAAMVIGHDLLYKD